MKLFHADRENKVKSAIKIVSLSLIGGVALTLVDGSFSGQDSGLRAAFVLASLTYAGALFYWYMGALRWKQYKVKPDEVAIGVPLVYWMIAALMTAFPFFVSVGTDTIWGATRMGIF